MRFTRSLATRPAAAQEQYNLIQYRFLNGPVVDGDAFNDGTCNFYMLVKLGSSESDGATLPQRYAILWIDEQTYFTQRWRLLHPTEDVLGDLFSLAHTIKDNPTWFPYSDTEFWNTRFWSPFADDLITDDSRMAVRRQIVAVTGYDPEERRHEIYTICFNYGVSDYTWRWRLFPPGEQLLLDRSIAQDRDPVYPDLALNGPADAYVLVNTLDLRDDSTLHVRGSKRTGAVSPPSPPRNRAPFQRFNPADGCNGISRPTAATCRVRTSSPAASHRPASEHPGTSSAKLPTGARTASTSSVSSRSRSSPAASTMRSSCCQETTGQPPQLPR